MEEVLNELGAYVAGERGDAVTEWHVANGELTMVVAPEAIVPTLTFLRDDPKLAFINFTDLCGVDWPAREKRFDVVYHLLSPTRNLRIRLKVTMPARP